MGFDVKVVADSVAPNGVRLITLETTYPRFIHSEMLRHRVFSHSVASSRAIPPDDTLDPETGEVVRKGLITRVREDPFIPPTFNERVKGMGVGKAFDPVKARESKVVWLDACEDACRAAERLVELNLDKSRVNRVLEPFMWVTDLITGTEWDNFFALRDHEAAQPEFQILAKMMRVAIGNSIPTGIADNMWHLPLVGDTPDEHAFMDPEDIRWAYVSAGRIARGSFDRHREYEDPDVSHERAMKLLASGHMSPFEHTATPLRTRAQLGNFCGWQQLRKTIPNEDNFALVVEE